MEEHREGVVSRLFQEVSGGGGGGDDGGGGVG